MIGSLTGKATFLRIVTCLCVALLTLTSPRAFAESEGGLSFGVAVTDITPEEGLVHDPLLAKTMYFRQGEAEALFRRALSIDLELLGPDHPSVAVDEINLGLLLCDADQTAEGVTLTSDAVRILGGVLEAGQWEMGAARSAYGQCLGQTGRFAEGERELVAALETVETALGPDHSRVGQIRARLAELYDAWGRPERARRIRDGGPAPRGGTRSQDSDPSENPQ